MKKKGHPPYQDILFVDTANGSKFVCGSTLQPKETEVYEGKEYPVYKISTSSASHPFFTGSQQLVDSEGRVSKFQNRYQQKRAQMQQQREQQQQQKEEQAKEDPKKKGRAKKSTS